MLFQCGLMYVCTCVEVVCSTWYIRWVSCVLHNALKCWVASAVRCCAAWHSLPLFNLRIRHSLGQSDTHSTSRAVSQPFGQSVSQSLAQSVNLAVHTPENSCQASECVWLVVAFVVCVLHFMTVIHFCVWATPPCRCYLRLFASLTLLGKKLLNCYSSHLW